MSGYYFIVRICFLVSGSLFNCQEPRDALHSVLTEEQCKRAMVNWTADEGVKHAGLYAHPMASCERAKP